jgi:hypothetical protein
MKLKGSPGSGFAPLQDALRCSQKTLDIAEPPPYQWHFNRFLDAPEHLVLALAPAQKTEIGSARIMRTKLKGAMYYVVSVRKVLEPAGWNLVGS